jgi:hypothetical protein
MENLDKPSQSAKKGSSSKKTPVENNEKKEIPKDITWQNTEGKFTFRVFLLFFLFFFFYPVVLIN